MMFKKEAILLVDDDPLVREMLAELLAEYYEVLVAVDGLEAAHLYENNSERIVALVTDLEMPRLSGQSLAERVHHINLHLPVIIMSGSFEKQALQNSSHSSMIRFLAKPFDTRELYQLLGSMIGGERLTA
jgi:CheY-like chemotaxis protein